MSEDSGWQVGSNSEPRPAEPDAAGTGPFTRLGPWLVAGFAIFLLLAYIGIDQLAPAGRNLIKVNGEDPVAYFGTTHSLLFDHDFNLTNEFAHLPPSGRWWTADQPQTGLPGSPWGLGYSFLEIPLLALGTGIDALAGNPADGYSPWAIFFYCIGTVITAGLGLIVLFPLLRDVAAYWKIQPADHQSAYALFVVPIIFLGSNVGYYAFSQMAHSSTFLFATLFLLCWWRRRDSESPRDWLVLGLIGGFLSICRWQDALHVIGPVLYDLFGGGLLRKRAAWWRSRFLYAAGLGIWWIPQVLQWKAIYGKYLTIPQGGGFFAFPPTHILQLLFSTQSGWFSWTPVVFLGVVGLCLGAFRAPRLYLPWLIVLALQIALIGSIPYWDGLGAFGARYLLSNVPMTAVGLITLYGLSGVLVRRGLSVACLACCGFTLLFAVQFRLDLIPLHTPLTYKEFISDKFDIGAARQRRAAVLTARELINQGNPLAAAEVLEAARPLGDDRDVELMLERAYRAAGRGAQADEASVRHRLILDSSLF